MIRIRKSADIPQSLQVVNCSKYDGQDVQDALYEDQDGKCYLCEQKTHKDFQIEHLKAKAEGYHPELRCTWSNLFLSCPYCNGRKPNDFDELLDPTKNNIEDIIQQYIIFDKNKVELTKTQDSESIRQTINLLDILFNGKSGIRDKRGQILYDDIQREVIFFMELLNQYRSANSQTNRQAIIDSLEIHKEFLGLKYWIIKNDSAFYSEFKDYLCWNRSR